MNNILQILELFANTLGYLLNFIYNAVGNFGISIIIFSIIIKIFLFSLELKSRIINSDNMKMSEKTKALREKYKDDRESLNKATIDLYRQEGVSPFAGCSGCLIAILQMLVIISMFFLMANPLTYMKKIDEEKISNYYDRSIEVLYNKEFKDEKLNAKEQEKAKEQLKMKNQFYKGVVISKYLEPKNEEEKKDVTMNTSFLGLNLLDRPNETIKSMNDMKDIENIKIMIIPILYIVFSFINISMVQKDLERQQKKYKGNKNKGNTKEVIIENKNKVITEEEKKSKKNEGKDEDSDKLDSDDVQEALMSSQKMLKYIMPVMIFFIITFTPLAIALYWLVNSIIDILKLEILKKVADKKIAEKEAKRNLKK